MDSNSAVVRLDDKPDKPFTLIEGKNKLTLRKSVQKDQGGLQPNSNGRRSITGRINERKRCAFPFSFSTHPGTRTGHYLRVVSSKKITQAAGGKQPRTPSLKYPLSMYEKELTL
ncbi:hypothetical protein EVAR_26463_1 [Eumeta japonica]|uniref:Uncharacterized protein n=1 Tax=Eumeta variegata TaxID=151549 RepID=A0A4C1Z335_EUMVA|nr:hypothetical protein EVAR_26463_1 [Eumeta japonica]